MEYRQAWLKELLQIQKQLDATGHEFPLIRQEELHAIRQEWLRDPVEPDMLDSLPGIYQEVYDEQIDWPDNDSGSFTAPDAALLKDLAEKHETSPEMIMKLIEVELSLSGLGRRKGIMRKLESLLKQDWDIEDAMDYRNTEYQASIAWRGKIGDLQSAIDEANKRLAALDEIAKQ